MLTKLMTVVLAVTALTLPAMAQTITPQTKPPMTTPAPATRSMTPGAPVAGKVNLNTATASELDALPDIGKARTKAIMDERSKGKFKDWADFTKRMNGTSVNQGVQAKIRDQVIF